MRARWAPRGLGGPRTAPSEPLFAPRRRDMLRPSLPSPRESGCMNSLSSSLRLPAVLLRYRELLSAFVRRELKARIEGSILGRVWPVLQPAVLFAIYYM